MPKLDVDAIQPTNRTGYPPPYDALVKGRWSRRFGDLAGFTDFGANYVTLDPGAASSQRHWHEKEDELVVMLSGEAVLVEEDARTPMRAGDIAVFRKGDPNGHHLVNESDAPCTLLAVGRVPTGMAFYPDIDLVWNGPDGRFERKDGSPY